MFGLGTTELLILAGVLLLLFGSTRLPSLMRNMGRSINEFKAGMEDKPTDKKDEIGDDSRGQEKLEQRDSEKINS